MNRRYVVLACVVLALLALTEPSTPSDRRVASSAQARQDVRRACSKAVASRSSAACTPGMRLMLTVE
jgi:hypothetical protein